MSYKYNGILFLISIFVIHLLFITDVKANFTNSVPVGQTGSWDMVFEDNFDGNSLDLSKWRPNWLGSSDSAITPPINSSEINCYDPSNISVSGGLLTFTARSNSNPACKDRTGSMADYSSGMIESHGKVGGDFTYGYIEARIKNPSGPEDNSFWPAFWTMEAE